MLGERPKTAEELNAELYEKVSAEFEEYKDNLLMMSPEQMLEHAYAYAVRSDIVIAIECGSIHARQAQALLKADNTLDEIGSNQLQPILNSQLAALAASLTAYSRCRLRHEVPRTSREYALLPP